MNGRLLLDNYDLWKEMMLYDVETMNYDIVERTEALGEMPLNGSYVERDGWVTLFYKLNGLLYFVAEGHTYCLQDEECSIYFERKEKNNEFRIEISGKQVYTHLYRSYWYDPINMLDITFNQDEEENQDFHLFVYNVMNNHPWRDRIYT